MLFIIIVNMRLDVFLCMQLVQALGKAKIATASVGKFTKALVRRARWEGSIY